MSQVSAHPAESVLSPDQAVASRRVASGLGRLAMNYAIVAALIAVLALTQVLYPGFANPDNLRNVLAQSAPVGIVAVGMTLVMIAGGFDLSVGALYALGATVYASLALQINLIGAAALTLAVGLLAGTVNGVVVTRLRINPFVATLGTTSVLGGLAFLYSHSQPFIVEDPSFTVLGRGDWLGLPISVWILFAVMIGGGLALSRTVYGRSLYVIGGNSEAARLAGLRVGLLRASTYVAVAGCSVAAGMIMASRLSVGQADIGGTIALDAIAVVVIGGTSLFGGEGAMWRTMTGLLILAVLTNLFDSLAIDSNVQAVVKGLIVIGAVSVDALARRQAV
jgi:ribose transport system permease protein